MFTFTLVLFSHVELVFQQISPHRMTIFSNPQTGSLKSTLNVALKHTHTHTHQDALVLSTHTECTFKHHGCYECRIYVARYSEGVSLLELISSDAFL